MNHMTCFRCSGLTVFHQICFEIPQMVSQSYTQVLILMLHLPSLVMFVK